MFSDPLHMYLCVSLMNGKSAGFRENPAQIPVLALYSCAASGEPLSTHRLILNTGIKYAELYGVHGMYPA